MRKSIFNKTIAVALTFALTTTMFVGCSKDDDDKKKDKDSDKKTEKESEPETTTEAVELDFIDTLVSGDDITSSEMTGTISVNAAEYGTYEYGYKMLANGDDAQFTLTDKNDTSSVLLDLVLYDYKIYVDFTKFVESLGMGAYMQEIPKGYYSVDLAKLCESAGVDLNSFSADNADMAELEDEAKEVLGIVKKAMPSVFGEEIVLGADNAEAVAEELIKFMQSEDLATLIDTFNEIATKMYPEEAGLAGSFDSVVDQVKDYEFTDEDKTTVVDALKMFEFKATNDIEGEKGSRKYNATLDFKIVDGPTEYNGIGFSIKVNMEEKEVDIASVVPTGAADYTDLLVSAMSSSMDSLTSQDVVEN